MPSWSSSEVPNDQAPPPAAPADEVEKARRLLEELFADASSDDAPTQSEQSEQSEQPEQPEH
jgi:hypothetical protein